MRRLSVLPLIVGLALLGGAVPAAAQDVDPGLLRERCQQNAPDAAELATCLRVVDAYLAPASPGASVNAPTTGDAIVLSGSGEQNTEAFELARGDYLITAATATDGGSFAGCLTQAYLRNAKTDDSVAEVDVTSGSEGRSTHQTRAYRVPAGRYYWSLLFACDEWTFSIAPMEVATAPVTKGPLTMGGSGREITTPFALAAGDHTVTWTVTPNSGGCTAYGTLRPVSEPYGGKMVEASADGGEPGRGTSHLYGLDKGTYVWDVWTMDFTWDEAPCAWEYTLRHD